MQAKEEVVEQKLAERRSLISQNIQNFKKKKLLQLQMMALT